MPKNTNILMVRHGEKPGTGPLLAVAGQERAEAYSIYFQNYKLGTAPVTLNHLFAAADSTASQRPRLTITPLAQALKLKINAKHKDRDYPKLAQDLLQNAKYDNSNILICWHHGQILQFAAALGASPATLPKSANWPPGKWPPAVFGWLLQLRFDGNGKLIPAKTVCLNEQLMYDDCGRDPPG